MTTKQNNTIIWTLLGSFVVLGLAGFVWGWGSATVHILGVLAVLLLLYQALKRRGA
jgi:hypothetical protein